VNARQRLSIDQEMAWLDRAQASSTPDEYKAFMRATDTLHVLKEDCTKDKNGNFICPKCKHHEIVCWSAGQRVQYRDCKTEICEVARWTDGRWYYKTIAQCTCTGPDHGVLERLY